MNSPHTLLLLSQPIHYSRDHPKTIETNEENSARTQGHLLRKTQPQRRDWRPLHQVPSPCVWWLSPGAKPARVSQVVPALQAFKSQKNRSPLGWNAGAGSCPWPSVLKSHAGRRPGAWPNISNVGSFWKMISSSLQTCKCQLANYIYNV